MFNALENSEKSDIFTQGRKWVKILYIYIKRVVSAAGTPLTPAVARGWRCHWTRGTGRRLRPTGRTCFERRSFAAPLLRTSSSPCSGASRCAHPCSAAPCRPARVDGPLRRVCCLKIEVLVTVCCL